MDRVLFGLTVSALSTLLLLLECSATPLPDRVFVRNDTSPFPANQTIADLVQQQTDTIRKLVSNHHSDYSHLPPPQKQKPNTELEELKIKCQHLGRLTPTTSTPTPTPTTPRATPTSPPAGFYITTESPPKPSPAPVKYIKLEPVILQKTILSDGRTIYYWHKSIPSQAGPAHVASTTPPPPPTTTTASSGYHFGDFFPSFYSAGGSEPVGTTTTEKTPATEELQLYQQQLKFVVPVPYAPPGDPAVRKPWEIDQYAYYPKQLQPENVNLQVPYVPTFHVIKAIAVPNRYDGGTGKEVEDFISI